MHTQPALPARGSGCGCAAETQAGVQSRHRQACSDGCDGCDGSGHAPQAACFQCARTVGSPASSSCLMKLSYCRCGAINLPRLEQHPFSPVPGSSQPSSPHVESLAAPACTALHLGLVFVDAVFSAAVFFAAFFAAVSAAVSAAVLCCSSLPSSSTLCLPLPSLVLRRASTRIPLSPVGLSAQPSSQHPAQDRAHATTRRRIADQAPALACAQSHHLARSQAAQTSHALSPQPAPFAWFQLSREPKTRPRCINPRLTQPCTQPCEPHSRHLHAAARRTSSAPSTLFNPFVPAAARG